MKKQYLLIIFLLVASRSWSQDYRQMIAKGTSSVSEIQTAAKAHFAEVGTARGNGYKPYKRWEYQALIDMDKDGMLKTSESYFKEIEKYNQIYNNSNVSSRTSEGTWEELGPTYWNQTSGWNPGVGRITSIGIDTANTNHIIVGANTGGVWKSTDGGSNWVVLTDNLSNITVYALSIDPTNSDTYFWGTTNGTILKSIDAGLTWNVLSTTSNQGKVNKILIDPTNTNKMFCSIEGGGLFKSTDAGINWTLIHASATNGYDIEFKPGNTNVIYASGNDFFKSINGGVTFESSGSSSSMSLWSQEYISGTNNWVRAASNQNSSITPKTGSSMGLFNINNYDSPTTNLITPVLNLSGITSPVLKFSYSNVSWDSDLDTFRVLYKTAVNNAWVELASYNLESTTWTDVSLNLPNPSSDYYIAFEGTANYGRGLTLDDVSVEDSSGTLLFENGFESTFASGPKMMAVSSDDPAVIYILEASSGIFGGFYKSTDSGTNFTKLDHTNKNYFGYSSSASDDRGQAPRDMDVVVNPTDVNDVHIAGILSWRSTDGGANFNITSQWVPQNATNEGIGYCHADIDIMEYVGDKLYVGSDGGIFVANNPLVVNNTYYTDLTAGLGIRQFYKIGISQSDPVVVSGGSQDNGTSVYGIDGVWRDWLGADGMESFVDKDDNNILYGTSQLGYLYKSLNGGQSRIGISRPLNKTGNWITPFEQDPSESNVIYTGYDEVYKSTNDGNTWSSISQNFVENLNHLKIAPSNNLVMLAAVNSKLFKTADGGTTDWTELSGINGSINSIAIHPTNPNKIAIATTGTEKVYVSSDGGTTWTSYGLNLPNFSARALVWQNNDNNGLYVGMNYGVFYIDDTFTEWQAFSNNLPNVIISELEINTVDNKIYTATYGRGLWKSDLYNETLSLQEFELNSIHMFPNPSSNNISLSWNKSEEVSIKIFNSLGKLMYFKNAENLVIPKSIDISNYASGIYFVSINNIKGVVTKKLIVE
jgi:photosystem II stability/assembly factor-like uncharacterized protein